MRFVKQHWFGLLTGAFIFCFLATFVLVLLSPRQDVRRRGFIPCTEAMAEEMLACRENRIGCMLSAILGNSWCDMKVIGTGIGDWAAGRQSWPWSNYIFIPELPQEAAFDEAAQTEYFENNPDTASEMQQLKKLNEDLEHDNEQLQINPEDRPE